MVLIAAPGCEVPGGVVAEHDSPGGMYRVQLIGRTSRPSVPPFAYIVRARVYRQSDEIVSRWEIHFADSMDTGFDDDYEKGASGVAPNVLRFTSTRKRMREGVPEDVVIVENKAGRDISCLRIEAEDLVPRDGRSCRCDSGFSGDVSRTVA